METHHESSLSNALDNLYLNGAVSIPLDDLYLWYNVERLGKGAWRDIIRRWKDRCKIYDHFSAPEISVLHHGIGQSMLTLKREAFKDKKDKNGKTNQEIWVPLDDWA